ncbi:hypothetical protein N9459_02845 [Flavobacteriaceae bacterium]|nr:hypothetical protein [Flavobacteriaceae bacterium]
MPIGIGIASGVLGLASVGVKLFGAKKTYKSLRKQASVDQAYATDMRNKLTQIENNRQDITDFSKNLSNPYANLGVATQATDIQIEQTDIALANTLDTIRATGAAAGGATALAQAALQSKKNVSANIEQQEVQNEKLRAQGQQYLEAQTLAEQQRQFNAQERREEAQLDRYSALSDQARAQQRASQTSKTLAQQSMYDLAGTGLMAGAYGLSSAGGKDGGGLGGLFGGNKKNDK